jgi:iron complex outermembrane receptor protein
MRSRVFRSLSLCVVVFPALGCELAAQETLELPQITVTAPSPIVRRRPAKPPTDAVPVAPAAPVAPADIPLLGTLPIVTDQFGTVTVVPTEEIKRSGGGTLGDLLFSKPGITGSSFAPGAASRPIVRGLDMHRVRLQENGIGANGASDLGEDHGVPIDPLATRQVEVIRGPATLRYGSQAIGGVVNADNNRIPTVIPPGGHSGEINGAVSSVDNGIDGSALIDAGKDNIAVHADVYGRNANEYRVPNYPYLPPAETQPFRGRQPNSAMRSNGESVGGSYIFDNGFVGAAVSQFNSLYHIPGLDGATNNTRIDMQQTKVTSKGEFRFQSSAVDTIRFWLGHSDYKHNELGFADPTDISTDGIRQTFTNKENEGRVEMQFAPVNLKFAALTTAVGVQGWHQDLTAPSPDGAGSILNGLFDPNHTNSIAGYIFNEFRLSPTLRTQIAGRIEQNKASGAAVAFPSNSFDIADLSSSNARERNFAPKSASFGILKDLPMDLVGSITAQYVQRAPRAPELFSRGPHDATTTFDIGNPDLNIEVAKSIEVGIKKAKGTFRFEANAYYTRFDGFIFRNLIGAMCNETSCGQNAGDEELRQAIYSQRDAIFRGGEFQFQWDTLPMWSGFWGVDGQYDVVRATFTDGANVPRIPPQRVGGGVYFRNAEWLGRISLLHAFAQNDVAVIGETPTAGYNLLKVEISHTRELKNDPSGIKKVTVGLVGNNLLNEDIRNHVSYTKDQVLMPGAGVRAFASVKY